MKQLDIITPEGTRDLLFEECQARRETEKVLKEFFVSRSFCEVVTPTIEFYDVFRKKGSCFSQESMYKLIDAKGRILVLRPDSTTPIARLAATRLKDAKTPIRLFYNQEVYTTNPSASGRSDSKVQMGVELIGAGGKRSDLEILFLAANSLLSVCPRGFRIEIGHIGFFQLLMDKLSMEDSAREQVRLLIESKNYAALNDALEQLGDTAESRALKELPRLFGTKEVFARAREVFDGEEFDQMLSYLENIYDALTALGLEKQLIIDLGLVNRAEYYTGIVFQGYLEGCGDVVLSGGRYDKLVGQFGKDFAGAGFGINIDTVAKDLLKRQSCGITSPDVLVYACPGYEVKALRYLKRLVDEGKKAENYVYESDTELLSYAKYKNIRRIDKVGESIEIIEL